MGELTPTEQAIADAASADAPTMIPDPEVSAPTVDAEDDDAIAGAGDPGGEDANAPTTDIDPKHFHSDFAAVEGPDGTILCSSCGALLGKVVEG